jgi:hypothetical protein
MSGKAIVGVVSVAFAIALAYVVGSRLSDEAIAIVVGLACGIGAMVPLSVGLAVALIRGSRRDETYAMDQPTRMPSPYPPVIVVAPPQMGQQPWAQYPHYQNYLPAPFNQPLDARDFKIVGEESEA